MPHSQVLPFPSSQAAPKKSRSPSSLVSRNIMIDGHRTSVRLEPEMWDGLREICRRERISLHQVCTSVAQKKEDETSLTAAIRVYVMFYYRMAATEDGHAKAGHGLGLTLIRMSGGAIQARPQALLTSNSFA